MFLSADKLFPLSLHRFEDNSTIVFAQNVPAHIFYTKDDKWRLITQVNEVTPLYLETLIQREDKYFYQHLGINPFAFLRASWQWLYYGRVISGGSTITMQTARLLEPRKRNISSKLIECFRALQLEWHYSKDDILKIYMTLAPFGSNIEGVNAAAMAYFNKSPLQLNPAEVALLVAMVQSPSRLNPCIFPENAYKARKNILDFMAKSDLISNNEAHVFSQAPLPKSKVRPPREIPHLAWRLKKQYQQPIIHSTIDLTLQKKVEFVLQSYRPFLPQNSNAAILIVDHTQRKPLAYVASRDYYDEQEHGFVDYITSLRSPGSTLKPFIYGLGFDMGYVAKNSFVLDERRRFGAYFPRNFDKEIYGTVTASDALAMSLNTPVVDLLNQVGVIRFIGLLKEAGITPQFANKVDSPSLAIALGGIGMTLEQLVTLYTALAQHGKVLPFSYVEGDHLNSEHTLFSEQVAKQISTILQTKMNNGRIFSIKTGTSYGHRDTLVLAFDSHYVIGIWIGMPDGSSMGTRYARDLSVPLLHKIANIMPQSRSTLENYNHIETLKLKDLSYDQRQASIKNKPTLLFPVDDSLIALEKSGDAYKAILLSVSGGKRPFTWLIDGKPLSSPIWQQNNFWVPPMPGYYTIAVIDANGQADRANIEVR
ncbi:MAG: penicillin-binding protein 1C [Candidatus Berkiella sp.]